MRRAALPFGLLLAASALAAPDKPAPPSKIVFVGPTDGPLAPTAEESFVGLKAALSAARQGDVAVELSREQPKKPQDWQTLFADLDRRGAAMAVAYVADGETHLVEKAAEKAKLPLLVLSPEPTRGDVDPARAVFWAGGLRPTEEALYAMDYLLTPLGARAPAVFHDGSARGAEAAAKCARMCHVSQKPRAPVALPADFGVADVKGLLGRFANLKPVEGSTSAGPAPGSVPDADGIVYFGGPAGAERLLSACADAKIDAPVVVGQGLVTRGVKSFVEGRATSAWGLESAYFEDTFHGRGSPLPADAAPLAEAAKATGGRLYAATIRGWRSGRWIAEALRRAPDSPEKKAEKKFLWAMRALARDDARGKPVFETWGHASLARLEAWCCGKYLDAAPCSRVKPEYLPQSGMAQIGFFDPARFKYEPGSYYVWLHWGKPEERTIESDLAALNLDPGGYEQSMRERIITDLMGRTLSRLNQLYLRNPDGTAIPGVSFNVTFGTEERPAGLKSSHRYEQVLRGDSPDTGGVAHGMTSEVFTTYIQRTIYAKYALKPPVSIADRVYIEALFPWTGSSLEQRMRSGEVRSLVAGYTQGFALTGAHEAGHMFGCGHDQTTPRSIMNVNEAVGLEFEWAEWSPEHVKLLEDKLGRVPVK